MPAQYSPILKSAEAEKGDFGKGEPGWREWEWCFQMCVWTYRLFLRWACLVTGVRWSGLYAILASSRSRGTVMGGLASPWGRSNTRTYHFSDFLWWTVDLDLSVDEWHDWFADLGYTVFCDKVARLNDFRLAMGEDKELTAVKDIMLKLMTALRAQQHA
jgi:hypothetical protein